jgi:hypothetical protein
MRRVVVAGLLAVVLVTGFTVASAEAGPIQITGMSCRGEWVDVRNTTSQSRNLQGFRLFDHNRAHRYDFRSVRVPPGAKVRVWGDGKTGGPVVRWFTGWDEPVWNNTGDRATLVNPNRDIVSTRSCDDVGGPGGGGGCHPSYRPCLPIVPDLDCADIDGPVTVIGPDEYRLDGDGDGIGCEGP